MSSQRSASEDLEPGKAALIFLFVLGLYFFTRSASLDEWDSYQFAMGVRHFDLWNHQPHPPGYPLYVFFGWIGTYLFQWDPGFSLQLVSCVGGALFVATWFLIIRLQFTERFAWLIAVSLTATPIVWMTSTKVLSDAPAVALLSLELLCVLRYRANGRTRELIAASLFGAVSAGIRPQLIAVVLVIVFVALRQKRAPAKVWTIVLVTLFASCLCWLMPMWYLQAKLRPDLPFWSVYPKQLLQQWSWRLDKPRVFIGAHGFRTKDLGLKLVTHFLGWFGLGLGFLYSIVTLVVGGLFTFTAGISYFRALSEEDREFWKTHRVWAAVYILIIFCCLPPYQRYYLIIMPLLLVVMLQGLLRLPRVWSKMAIAFVLLLVAISLPLVFESHTEEAPVRKFVRYLEEHYSSTERGDVLLLLTECARPVQWYAPQFSIIRDLPGLTSVDAERVRRAKAIYTDDPKLILPPDWRLTRLAFFQRSMLIDPKHHDIGVYKLERVPGTF